MVDKSGEFFRKYNLQNSSFRKIIRKMFYTLLPIFSLNKSGVNDNFETISELFEFLFIHGHADALSTLCLQSLW